MGYPGIAPVGVVFDEEEAAARPQVAFYTPDQLFFLPGKVEGIGHEDAVQRWQDERLGEIGRQIMNSYLGEVAANDPFLLG